MRTTKELLGRRIHELRKMRGMSQERLAEHVGIDPKHLSRIEVGGSFPSLATLERLAQTLGVELKECFEFVHHAAPRRTDLRRVVSRLTREAKEDQLKLAVKVLRALFR